MHEVSGQVSCLTEIGKPFEGNSGRYFGVRNRLVSSQLVLSAPPGSWFSRGDKYSGRGGVFPSRLSSAGEIPMPSSQANDHFDLFIGILSVIMSSRLRT
jgi:hypothetical protein